MNTFSFSIWRECHAGKKETEAEVIFERAVAVSEFSNFAVFRDEKQHLMLQLTASS